MLPYAKRPQCKKKKVIESEFVGVLFHLYVFRPYLFYVLTRRYFRRWFREGQQEITDSVTRSTSRDSVTSAVLNLKPSRTDDGAIYRCVVWNRAMPEGMKLETKVALAVNCK